MDHGTLALLIPIIGVSIPIVAILIDPISRRQKMSERREARKLYERIAMEKLDVMKTAITMGYDRDGLKDLDERLEKLIGSEQLKSLLDDKKPGVPVASQELRDSDLSAEVDQQRKGRLAE